MWGREKGVTVRMQRNEVGGKMCCECGESPETCRTAWLFFPRPSLLLTVPSNLAESIAFAYEEASGEVLLNLGGQHHQCHEAELLLTEGVIT